MSQLPTTTEAWCAEKQGAKLVLKTVPLMAASPTTVDIQIMYCGLCHTDIHMVNNDWGASVFPIVPGHEGVGKVVHVGQKVRNIAVGDMVAVGWIRDSCRSCKNCQRGHDNVCLKGYQGTFLGSCSQQGCFAKMVRIEEDFAFKLPETIPPQSAGPLLCAGITVYNPLRMYASPNSHVGILGLGGLGHMAVKFAQAMGCHITVLSTSESKRKDSLERLGAHRFVNISNAEEMLSAASTLDLIIDCAPRFERT